MKTAAMVDVVADERGVVMGDGEVGRACGRQTDDRATESTTKSDDELACLRVAGIWQNFLRKKTGSADGATVNES